MRKPGSQLRPVFAVLIEAEIFPAFNLIWAIFFYYQKSNKLRKLCYKKKLRQLAFSANSFSCIEIVKRNLPRLELHKELKEFKIIHPGF